MDTSLTDGDGVVVLQATVALQIAARMQPGFGNFKSNQAFSHSVKIETTVFCGGGGSRNRNEYTAANFMVTKNH